MRKLTTFLLALFLAAGTASAQTTTKIATDITATGQTGAMQVGPRTASVSFEFCGTGFSGDLYVDAGATAAGIAQVWTTTLAGNSDCTTTYAPTLAKWFRVRWTRTAGTLNIWMARTSGDAAAGGGGAGITNGAGANVIPKSDGTNLVASALSEASAGAITTSAGTALGLTATAPAATTGASQAGVGVTVTASPAVASTDTAGAAAGGSVTITAGAAARNASGNANGGDINLVGGAGIGTGTTGRVVIGTGAITGVSTNSIQLGSAATPNGRVLITGGTAAGANGLLVSNNGILGFGASVSPTLYTDGDTFMRRRAAANPAWGAASATPVAYTHNLAADARPGTDADTAGATATIQPGLGTGVGGSGDLILSVAPANAVGGTATTVVVPQPVLTLAKTATTLTVPTPVAGTGASQAGNSVTITASPAVASTDTAGAAAGGDVTITAGAAARLTSGNADGGDVIAIVGQPIGTGTAGKLVVRSEGATVALIAPSSNSATPYRADLGIYGENTILTYFDMVSAGQGHAICVGSQGSYGINSAAAAVSGGGDTLWRRRAAANPAWGKATAMPAVAPAYTHNLAADATGTDGAGGNATLAPGVGTGAGTPSTLIVQTPDLGSTGSVAQTLTTRAIFDSTGISFPSTADGATMRFGTAASPYLESYKVGNAGGIRFGRDNVANKGILSATNTVMSLSHEGLTGSGLSFNSVWTRLSTGQPQDHDASIGTEATVAGTFRFAADSNASRDRVGSALVVEGGTPQLGTSSDKAGGALTLQGGVGVGTGGSGTVKARTAYPDSTGTTTNTHTDRIHLEPLWVSLTESSATSFSKLSFAASAAVGAEYFVTIEANDGTDYQSLTSRVRVSSVRAAAGNTVSTTNLVGTDLLAASSGTLTATFTVVEGATGVTVAANAVSSLTQTALRISYQAVVNGPGTVGAP